MDAMKKWLTTHGTAIAVVLPILFMFLGVFVTRSSIKTFFAMAIAMIILQILLLALRKPKGLQAFAVALITLSSIGVTAASVLTIEKIELLKDPNHVTSCSLSPVVSCSPVVSSPQASAFSGVPNPVIGIFAFACVFAAGMTLLAGAEKLNRAWWLTLFAGVLFGCGFSAWLIHEGVYEIGSLCLYCMSVWLISFSLFWIVGTELVRQKHIRLPKKAASLIIENRNTFMTVTYGIVALLLYFRWSDYWNSLF